MRAWIFYAGDKTAYLAQNKLFAMSDDFAIQYLDKMKPRENRTFSGPVQLKVVKAKKRGGLLVHRIEGSAGMQKRQIQGKFDM